MKNVIYFLTAAILVLAFVSISIGSLECIGYENNPGSFLLADDDPIPPWPPGPPPPPPPHYPMTLC